MSRPIVVAIAVILLLTATGCSCALKRPVPTAGPTSPPQPTALPTEIPTTPVSEASDPTSPPPEPQATAPSNAGYLGEKKQGGNLGDVWTLAEVRVGIYDHIFVHQVMKFNAPTKPYYNYNLCVKSPLLEKKL